MTTLNLQVAASTDDAYESSGGSMDLDTNYLRSEGGRTAGMRFNNVTIPQGATIDTADPQIYIYSTDYDDFDNTLYCEDEDDPGTFTTDDYDITSRTKTTANVSDTTSSAGTGWHSFTDAAAPVQEVVNRGGWNSGNDLILLMYENGAAALRFWAWDYDTALASKLDVDYTTAQIIGMDTLSLTSSVEGATLSPGAISLLMDALTLASSAEGATLAPGAVSLLMDALTLVGSAEGATLAPGAVSLLLDALTLASSAEGATLSPGAVSLLLDALTLTSSAEGATLSPGAVSLLMDALTLASGAENLTWSGLVQLAMDTLTLAGSAEGATLSPGAVSLLLDALTLASSAIGISIFVPETPTQRILIIDAESRSFMVDNEERTLVVSEGG